MNLKSHNISEWQIDFVYPDGWQTKIESGEVQIRANNYKATQAEVSMELVATISSNNEVASLLEKVTASLSTKIDRFELVNKEVKTGKDAQVKGVFLFKHSSAANDYYTQGVLIPLASGKVLFVQATSLVSSWKDFRQAFAEIIKSIQQSKIEQKVDDFEIVFHDTPKVNGQVFNSSSSTGSFVQKNQAVQNSNTNTNANSDFETFANKFNQHWQNCSRKEDLLAVTQDEGIAKVLWAALGSMALNWVTDSIPALDSKTVKQVSKTPTGRHQLKSFLLCLNEKADNILLLAKRTDLIKREQSNSDQRENVAQMLKTDIPGRDNIWLDKLFKIVDQANFYCPENSIITDVRGVEYYAMYTDVPAHVVPRQLSIPEIIDELSEGGRAIAINPERQDSVVFSYGQIWGYRIFNRFLDMHEADLIWRKNTGVNNNTFVVGAPSEKILPNFARRVLRRHIQDICKIKRPMVKLTIDGRQTPANAFSFNIYQENFTSIEHFSAVMDSVLWFMPTGTALEASANTSEGRKGFVEL